MSKPVKDQITKELTKKFESLEGVGVINPRGIDATKNNKLRRKLHEQGMKMTVVKNTLARRAVVGKKLEGFDKLLDGPSAVVYGEKSAISSIARLLLDEKKADDTLELRGIFFDGEVYIGADGVKKVSTLPTREEAIANLLGAILGPGAKLAAAFKGPGNTLGGIMKTIVAKAPAAVETPAAPVAVDAPAAPVAETAPAAPASA
jgi:large subunit ribosomal protein L10